MADYIPHIDDPAFYFQKYDFHTGTAIFREMSRDSFRESSFLDDRLVSLNQKQSKVAIEQAMKASLSSNPQECKLIFHTAYCCSTLMSRVLDITDRTIVYREPVHLHQLAAVKRRFSEFPSFVTDRWHQFLSFSLSMLSKRWGEAEAAVIKPTDSCNNIIADILRGRENGRAILLYSQAQEFISSNLKSAGRRRFLKNFLGRSIRENALDVDSILHSVDASTLSDAESAAYVWMTQIQNYRKAMSEVGDQCLCIDSAVLLADTRHAMMESSQFLELGLSGEDINIVVNSGIWKRHAKDTARSFSSVDRKDEMVALSKSLEAEIVAGLAWIEKFDGWDARVRFDHEISISGTS